MRAERRLLEAHGREIWERRSGIGGGKGSVPFGALVDLGSGNGEKLVALVEAGRPQSSRLSLHLIDSSPSALASSSRALAAMNDVHIVTHEALYEVGLAEGAGFRLLERWWRYQSL